MGARVAHRSCVVLAIEAGKFQHLMSKYPDDAQRISHGADCHKDRACAVFGKHDSFKRYLKFIQFWYN